MMKEFQIGTYRFCHELNCGRHSLQKLDLTSYLDHEIKSYDQVLHQTLDKIFQRHLSISGQINELLRNQSSIIKPILKKEPVVRYHFSKETFEELSLLWIAVLAGYTDSAELLVRFGADVNERFGSHVAEVIDKEWTILHVLIQMVPSPENEQLIRLITENGADLQARDSYGRTVLNFAVTLGRVQLTELFLEKGADANVADKRGETPFTVSILSNKAAELLLMLLQRGFDVSTKTRFAKNALHLLAWSSDNVNHFARAFIEMGVSLDDREDRKGFQPIHEAAWTGKNQLVKLYLDHGADVNARAKLGQSPLCIASRCGYHPAVVETLIERGANINLRANNGGTALHRACQNSLLTPNDSGQKEIIKLLLTAGADVLIEDHDGNTPFSLVNRDNIITDNKKLQRSKKIQLIIKALALKKASQPSINLKDEMILERCSEQWDYYQDCYAHVSKMKYTRLIRGCTFFELLTRSQYQIAALMRNPNFEANFKLYDLSGFSMYAEDLLQTFERAQKHYSYLLKQEQVINEALYQTLSRVVVEKVVCYLFHNSSTKKM